MSGHSKWSKVKHQKKVTDAKKGQVASKMARLITLAAKEKGGDPDTNPKLRMAIEQAKRLNVPKENIERAIKRGTGEFEGAKMEEVFYEAYGPAGIALIIQGITDNKNRTLAQIKNILSRFNGKLTEAGSVKYLFDRKNEDWTPKYPLEITDQKTKEHLEKLFETLDENEDIQEIYSNLKKLW